MVRSFSRIVLSRLRARLGPRALRLAEKLLGRAGFPTNPSGNNMSMR